MHDPGRVRVCDPGEELHDERCADLRRERPMVLEDLPQRRPADELDDEILLRLVLRRDVEHLHDVRVPQLRDRFRLDGEAVRDLAALAKVRMEHLDRDIAEQALVVRAIDRGHPAMPELVEHVVLGEDGRAARPTARAGHHRDQA